MRSYAKMLVGPFPKMLKMINAGMLSFKCVLRILSKCSDYIDAFCNLGRCHPTGSFTGPAQSETRTEKQFILARVNVLEHAEINRFIFMC